MPSAHLIWARELTCIESQMNGHSDSDCHCLTICHQKVCAHPIHICKCTTEPIQPCTDLACMSRALNLDISCTGAAACCASSLPNPCPVTSSLAACITSVGSFAACALCEVAALELPACPPPPRSCTMPENAACSPSEGSVRSASDLDARLDRVASSALTRASSSALFGPGTDGVFLRMLLGFGLGLALPKKPFLSPG